jgi:hypothetical protein
VALYYSDLFASAEAQRAVCAPRRIGEGYASAGSSGPCEWRPPLR